MFPEWVEKQKRPGTTIKAIGNNYYLYFATSARQPGKKYPVAKQVYIGKITENGIVSDRVSINIGETKACTLGELFPSIKPEVRNVIVLFVKNEWVCTKTDERIMSILESEGACKNGKIILCDI